MRISELSKRNVSNKNNIEKRETVKIGRYNSKCKTEKDDKQRTAEQRDTHNSIQWTLQRKKNAESIKTTSMCVDVLQTYDAIQNM